MSFDGKLGRLFGGASACVLLFAAHAAQAQTGAVGDAAVDEVVVTATKQASTINRVPLSVTAVTREALDEQGVKTADDLARITPSLQISTPNTANGANVTLRGISSTVGAPTVGIYLDDVPLQRRNGSGAVAGNGTAFPQLFDMERVEVLRGPQGTLYGGSALGGAIRFILPAPSLTRRSLRAKTEVGTTKDGSESYEFGVSGGGPIVEDKVGFHLSAYGRRTGGYLDHVSRFDGRVLAKDTNWQDSYSARAALLFQPTEALRITPSIYASQEAYNDIDLYWTDFPQFTAPAVSTATVRNGVSQTFVYPARAYGPYDAFGPYRSGMNCNVGDDFAGKVDECVPLSGRKSRLLLPSLTLDYDLGFASLKSVTSYTDDKTTGLYNFSFADINMYQPSTAPYVASLPMYVSLFNYDNRRKGWTEELRAATSGDRRLSIVGGVFYSSFETDSFGSQVSPNIPDIVRIVRGRSFAENFGGITGLLPGNVSFVRDQTLKERELAGFGEATFKVTEALRLIGGVRVSRTRFSYREANYGPGVNRLTATPGSGLTVGSVSETPISPKVVAQYFIDDRNMVYAGATKGFRMGGVSPAPANCAADLAAIGLGPSDAIPYKSDTVWSYEAGAKVRPVGDLVSVNAAVYRIDWKDAQVNYSLPVCRGAYIANAGSARSQGFDLSVQVRPARGLSLNAQLAYVDARFDEVKAPNGAVLINQDDRLPTPKWSYTLGGQYSFPVRGRMEGYLRADYQYAGRYFRTFGPGTANYTPDTVNAEATHYVSARVGVKSAAWDLSIFANNLLNSQDVLSSQGGRAACSFVNGALATCTRNTPYFQQQTFRPRTVGVTLRYSY